METNELRLRAAVCEAGRRLWQRGLVGAGEGNLSCRLSARQLLVTPSGISKGHMRPSDLLVTNLDGEPIRGDGRVSSEVGLHIAIYRGRPDCQAVVHAHPPVATGFALAGEDIPDDLLPESAMVLGSVATVPFAMPGTPEVGQSIEPLLPDHKTFLLASHGAVVMGKDIYDATFRMETLERVATVILHAHAVGQPKSLPKSAFDQLGRSALHGRLS